LGGGDTQQWNFTIQHELGHDWFAELGYVGTKGSRLRSTYDPDQGTLPQRRIQSSFQDRAALICKPKTHQCRAPSSIPPWRMLLYAHLISALLPVISKILLPTPNSHYSALQARLGAPHDKGLYFQSAYTWSKSIDDVSTASVAFLTRVNDQNDARASRGLSTSTGGSAS